MGDSLPSRNEGHPDKICDQVSDAAPRSMMIRVCNAVPAAATAATACLQCEQLLEVRVLAVLCYFSRLPSN